MNGIFRFADATHHRDMRFDDARFFSRDLFMGIPEDMLVIETDADDRGDAGVADIGAIESAAKTDFQDHRVAALSLKVEQCHGGGQLKKRSFPLWPGSEFVRDGADAIDQRDEIGFNAQFAIDAKAFLESIEVWGGIEPCSESAGGQHGGDHRCGRPFSLRAGEMDEWDRGSGKRR